MIGNFSVPESGSNEHFGCMGAGALKECFQINILGVDEKTLKKCSKMNIMGIEEETLKKCLPGKHLMGAPVPTAHT